MNEPRCCLMGWCPILAPKAFLSLFRVPPWWSKQGLAVHDWHSKHMCSRIKVPPPPDKRHFEGRRWFSGMRLVHSIGLTTAGLSGCTGSDMIRKACCEGWFQCHYWRDPTNHLLLLSSTTNRNILRQWQVKQSARVTHNLLNNHPSIQGAWEKSIWDDY